MLSKLCLELARRSNNGELFNKRTSRDQKDKMTVFFYNLSEKLKRESHRSRFMRLIRWLQPSWFTNAEDHKDMR